MKCQNCPESKQVRECINFDCEDRLKGYRDITICLETGQEAEPEMCEVEDE